MQHPNPLAPLLRWFFYFLGYRAVPPPKIPDYTVLLWPFVGTFCSISVIQAVFGQAQHFIEGGVPSIIPSYGGTAVLIYGAIDAPVAAPRALFGGHFFGALTGICITKLFRLLLTEQRFRELAWLAGSLSCASSIVLMQITATIHPPAGATALLAAVNTQVRDMGWYYLPVVLLSSALALAVALLTNNVQRRYPIYWFEPAILSNPEKGDRQIVVATGWPFSVVKHWPNFLSDAIKMGFSHLMAPFLHPGLSNETLGDITKTHEFNATCIV